MAKPALEQPPGSRITSSLAEETGCRFVRTSPCLSHPYINKWRNHAKCLDHGRRRVRVPVWLRHRTLEGIERLSAAQPARGRRSGRHGPQAQAEAQARGRRRSAQAGTCQEAGQAPVRAAPAQCARARQHGVRSEQRGPQGRRQAGARPAGRDRRQAQDERRLDHRDRPHRPVRSRKRQRQPVGGAREGRRRLPGREGDGQEADVLGRQGSEGARARHHVLRGNGPRGGAARRARPANDVISPRLWTPEPRNGRIMRPFSFLLHPPSLPVPRRGRARRQAAWRPDARTHPAVPLRAEPRST